MPFLCPGVRACRQTSPQNFCLCVEFSFFSFFIFRCRCVYGSGSVSNNPLIVCHVQMLQFLGCVLFLRLLFHVSAHASVSAAVLWGFYFFFFPRIYSASANDLVCVCKERGAEGVYCPS